MAGRKGKYNRDMKKQLIVVGGANGVGKTTFSYQYKQDYGIEYLGADEIFAQLSIFNKGSTELQAGKEFFKRLDGYLGNKKSVIIESTLSGIGLKSKIVQFKSTGFAVHIVYVFLDHVDLCKRRIELRVQKGGHNVPVQDIERR